MPQRSQNKILFIYLLLISFFCFADHKYISPLNTSMSDNLRYVFHLLFLMLIGYTGLIAWNKKEYPWQRVIWLFAYSLIIVFVFVTGIIHYFFPFGKTLKETFSIIRVGFANPLPFIMVFVLTMMFERNNKV